MNQSGRFARNVALRLTACVFAIPLLAVTAQAVTIRVDLSSPGPSVSEDALGLSYETSLLLPSADGQRYFDPSNKALLGVFKSLGIKSLRIGGNSVDDPKVAVPTHEDVRSLFEFARAADVKVMYSVRLQEGDPSSAAQFAKLIGGEYADVLECFAIGNEPGYYKDYDVYSAKWTAIRDAMVAAYPQARFCGPDQNPEPEFIKRLVHDFGDEDGRLVQITQHSYPFGCSYENPGEGLKDVTKLRRVDPADGRARMLSSDAYATYTPILEGMRSAVADTRLTFRLTETNSFWFSGLEGASDRFASALWGLDYLLWWTSHGVDGINFHTGDRTGGSVNLPCRYAAFVTLPERTGDVGYEVRPLGYGMKMFDIGGYGQIAGTRVHADSGEAETSAISAYARLRDDGNVDVTIINRSHYPNAAAQPIRIEVEGAPTPYAQATMMSLSAKGNDIAATSHDAKLGGAAIASDGEWDGHWHTVTLESGSAVATLPPASAAVIRFK